MPFVRSVSATVLFAIVAFLPLASGASGCAADGSLASLSEAVSGLGDPCTPEAEFDPASGGAQLSDLGADLNSTMCTSRVCLSHYFQGRVTCPYGNGEVADQEGTCLAVPELRGLYTLDGTLAGEPCCPRIGDLQQRPLAHPVSAQCSARPAIDAVYCSCRCDVPAGVDRASARLCACPSGFSCLPILDEPGLAEGRRGSYCVKDGPLGADLSAHGPADPSALAAACGAPRSIETSTGAAAALPAVAAP